MRKFCAKLWQKRVMKFFEEREKIEKAVYYLMRIVKILSEHEKKMSIFLSKGFVRNDFQSLELRRIDLEFIAPNNQELLSAYENIIQNIGQYMDSVPGFLRNSSLNPIDLMLIKDPHKLLNNPSQLASNNLVFITKIIYCIKALNDYFIEMYFGWVFSRNGFFYSNGILSNEELNNLEDMLSCNNAVINSRLSDSELRLLNEEVNRIKDSFQKINSRTKKKES